MFAFIQSRMFLALAACMAAATADAAILSVNPVADAFVTTGPGNNLSDNNYGGAGALASPELL
ncbi:MAG: hypothetical protein ACREKL_01650 [Chthoniobacterales bacterium]